MKNILIALSLASIFLFSCSNNENSKEKTESHEEFQSNETIELNNGEKWKVDANMLVAIHNMENDINSTAKASQKDYNSLSTKLESNLDLLISSCTMKGKSHDELHKWLIPYKKMVEEFSEAKDDTEKAKLFENIQGSLKEFNQYFQ